MIIFYWVLLFLFLVLTSAVTETEEEHPFAVFFMLTLIAGFGHFTNLFVLSLGMLTNHLPILLAKIGIYIVIGVLYSLLLWYLKVKGLVNRANRFFAEYSISQHGDATFDTWLRTEVGATEKAELLNRPKALDHKARIMIWMMYWPLSIIGRALKVFKLWKYLYNLCEETYNKIAEHAYGKAKWKDSPEP